MAMLVWRDEGNQKIILGTGKKTRYATPFGHLGIWALRVVIYQSASTARGSCAS
jgi:hypothetical protein